MSFYYILLFILGLIIFKKTTIIITFILLNINYIWYVFNNTLPHDIYKYILFIIIGVLFVFRQNAILPFSMIYIFLFLVYQIENIYHFYGDFNAIV
jgi:hypothetical protein